jgi:hypothetical protein
VVEIIYIKIAEMGEKSIVTGCGGRYSDSPAVLYQKH